MPWPTKKEESGVVRSQQTSHNHDFYSFDKENEIRIPMEIISLSF